MVRRPHSRLVLDSSVTDGIGRDIDHLMDVKLMVIRQMERRPELANRVFLEIGRKEPADTNASVTRVLRAEYGEAVPENVEIELQATAPADIAPLQLDQALGHLVKNAHQATISGERVRLRTWNSPEEVFIQVSDEGHGIAREHLRRVFEPFFTTRGVGKGIGLGLTAAYGIVRRVGGDVEAQSEGHGHGASFTIRLPRAAEVTLARVA